VKEEVQEKHFSDEMREMRALETRISKEIGSILGLSAKVTLVEPKTLQRSEGKAQHVEDRRTLT
jgi:phenylacetate-CoA ligase